MPELLSIENINSFIEQQLALWPLACDNFCRLKEVRRKKIAIGDLECAVQFNPARMISTGAKIDKSSIQKRPCFLCRSNRDERQISIDFIKDWELLINPFPIFPVHFTIPHKSHRPQEGLPLELIEMAEKAPSLTFFYNGARAGASAPDHQHAQAVLTSELPLMLLTEKIHNADASDVLFSDNCDLDLPFQFVSLLIYPDARGYALLKKVSNAFGIDAETGEKDGRLINAFFRIDSHGRLRIVIVPRRRHRPSCYDADGDNRFVISPGAIDMTGIIISPREDDFVRISENIIRRIYSDVAFDKELPAEIKDHFNL